MILVNEMKLVLHDKLQDFAGGHHAVLVKADTEIPGGHLKFGAENGDHRFERRITVLAGQ